MDKVYISEIVNEQSIESLFAITQKGAISEHKKGYMFKLTVADSTGDIELKYFGKRNRNAVESVLKAINEGNVIYVKAKSQFYNDVLSIVVNDDKDIIRPAENNEYNLDMFLKKTDKSISKLTSYLRDTVGKIDDVDLQKLLDSVFEDETLFTKFKNWPAAIRYHHACIGGLLEHTVAVTKICRNYCEINELNQDLVTTGAILHDIGKIETYEPGIIIKATEKETLYGHIVCGAEIIANKIKTLDDFPKELENKVLHMILSHHGTKENGSPVEPKFPEAALIHFADKMDSSLKRQIEIKKEALKNGSKDFRCFDSKLGEIYLK